MDTDQNKKPDESDATLAKKQWEGLQYAGGERKEPRGKLHCYNWLGDIPGGCANSDLVEVQFKNTRKGYYRNSANLDLCIGDIVAVEAQPGHDIGQVTMTGQLVALQMKKANLRPDVEIRRVFRKAKPADIEKFERARARETDTMIQSRKIAESLGLNMKIGDVEYQGDGNKAIFYYISDERVDFRKLIKILAETFKVRIEMKQIGARQEAGRIGGIGPCGRPLCCSSWMTNFVTVATSAARHQDLSLNPQKLAGQCAKLKCCLNFEVDAYVESVKRLPPRDMPLETADATYYHFKTDIFKRELTYSTDKHMPANLVTIPADRVFEVIALNKAGEKPLTLLPEGADSDKPKKDFVDLVGQDSVTRFDKTKKKKKKSGRGQRQQPQQQQQQPQQQAGRQPAELHRQQQQRQHGGNRQGQQNKGPKPQQGGQPQQNQNANQNQQPRQQRNRQRPRPPKPQQPQNEK